MLQLVTCFFVSIMNLIVLALILAFMDEYGDRLGCYDPISAVILAIIINTLTMFLIFR